MLEEAARDGQTDRQEEKIWLVYWRDCECEQEGDVKEKYAAGAME